MFGEEKKEFYGAETFYRELGWYQRKRKQYEGSLRPFDKAIELTPLDKRTLTGRSWSRSKTARYDCALEDVNKALDAYSNDLELKQLKALYKFLNSKFEESLVLNYRGNKLRKRPGWFNVGVKTCAEAVEQTIGKRGGRALRDHYDIIRLIAWKKALDLDKGQQWKPRFKKQRRKQKKTDITPAIYNNYVKKMVKSDMSRNAASQLSILESLTTMKEDIVSLIPKKPTEYFPPQRRTKNIHNVMAEKYWNKLCYDKTCLKNLKTDPRLKCPNEEGYKQIVQLAKKCYKNIDHKQEILRTRRPFYSIKYSEAKSQGALLERQMDALRKCQEIACNDVETLLRMLRTACENNLTNAAIHLAHTLKSYIDKKPNKFIPNKEKYLRVLYELIGMAYLLRYRLRDGMLERDASRRINFLFGLPISREASMDSVIQANKKEFMDVKKAVTDTEERMANCTTPLETVWLFYDLAKFSLELKKWDLSRFYARKSINMALLLENYVWAINACMLIITSHVLQQNRHEAKNELIRTRDFAKILKHGDILKYIDRCIDEVESIDYDEISPEKVIFERESDIINTVVPKLQQELEVLFMKMDALPPPRKMSIMPGVRFEQGLHKGGKKKSASILPSTKSAIEFKAQLSRKKGLELLED